MTAQEGFDAARSSSEVSAVRRRTLNERVGAVVANLLSLELLMRFLLAHEAREPTPAFHELKAGQYVAEGTLTNYDTLSQVVARTNELLEAHGIPERVDPAVVDLRDAFAHGRKVYVEKDEPGFLVKFARPKNGRVRVQTVFTLTDDELRRITQFTYGEIRKVAEAGQKLSLGFVDE